VWLIITLISPTAAPSAITKNFSHTGAIAASPVEWPLSSPPPLNRMPAPARNSRLPWMIALIVLAILLSMGRLSFSGFTEWDDSQTIHRNPDLNPPTFSSVAHYWLRPHMSLYIPVTYTVWGVVAFMAQVSTPDD